MQITPSLRIAAFSAFSTATGDPCCPARFLQRELDRRLPGISWSWFSSSVPRSLRTDSTSHSHPACKLTELYPEGPDAIIIGPGSVLRLDPPGEESSLPETRSYPLGADLWLLPTLAAAEWQTPVLWSAPAASVPFSENASSFVSLAGRLALYRSVRDPISLDLLRQGGVRESIELAPDPSLLIAREFRPSDLQAAWGEVMGSRILSGTPTLCLEIDENTVADNLANLRGQLAGLQRRHFRQILVLPVADDVELEYVNRLAKDLGPAAILLDRPLSSLQRAAIVHGADAWIGSRLEDCYRALAFHRPHLLLGADPELLGYVTMLGQPELLLADASELAESAPWLLADRRSVLEKDHQRLCRQIDCHFDEVARLLSVSCQKKIDAKTKVVWDVQGLHVGRHQPVLAALSDYTLDISQRENSEQRRTIAELETRVQEIEARNAHHRKYYGQLRFRVVEILYKVFRKGPLFHLILSCFFRAFCGLILPILRKLKHRGAFTRCMDRLLFLNPSSYWLCKRELLRMMGGYLKQELEMMFLGAAEPGLQQWFQRYRPTPTVLAKFASRRWPSYAPTFTIVIRLNGSPIAWLEETLASVQSQTYPNWEAVLVATNEPLSSELQVMIDRNIRRMRLSYCSEDAALNEARGEYICWLDHGDSLEPQALHRFADVILKDAPHILYSDAVVTGDNLENLLTLSARPAFSYDYFLAHGYFDHLLGVRTECLQHAGGLGAAGAPDTDCLLRVMEHASSICHVPDILYRRRFVPPPSFRESALPLAFRQETVESHLDRLGWSIEVRRDNHSSCLDVHWPLRSNSRTAVIIPTKNQQHLLRKCIDGLEATIPMEMADICVVDHESKEPESASYLAQLGKQYQVLPYQGEFNYSIMMNHAVARLTRPCDFYLFLNNDVEAFQPGWLEHMLGLACREDVGAVGALLVYPDQTIQHGGAIVGLHYAADHTHKMNRAFGFRGQRLAGPGMAFTATRDQSIVTGACLLVRADVYHRVGGFDTNFAVGFGDSDLCLRIRALGYKVLLDSYALLVHHESATRGKSTADPHPVDTQLFRTRYLQLLLTGDPCYNPLLSRQFSHELNPFARSREEIRPRTTALMLPRPAQSAAASVRPRLAA